MSYHRQGVHAIVDGQFGSTGKGAFAAYIAKRHGHYLDCVVSNAGPNSGHTFYGPDDYKHVLKQLPTLAVAELVFHKRAIPVMLSAGAVIDPEILNKEAAKYDLPIFLSRQAAIIRPEDKAAEMTGSIAAVAGTRQGVGIAVARKVMREHDAVVDGYKGTWHPNIKLVEHAHNWERCRIGLEVSQGFSLGLNSRFYPKVTSRECTVMQGLADARIPAQRLIQVGMTLRTYPIRVGNVDGHSSGDYYPDQEELSWKGLGLEPELTTVTQRVRRVFSFSQRQFNEALLANMPASICINFMDYLKRKEDRVKFANMLTEHALITLHYRPEFFYGFGPKVGDMKDNPIG